MLAQVPPPAEIAHEIAVPLQSVLSVNVVAVLLEHTVSVGASMAAIRFFWITGDPWDHGPKGPTGQVRSISDKFLCFSCAQRLCVRRHAGSTTPSGGFISTEKRALRSLCR